MSTYVTLPRPEPPPWKSAWRMDFERRYAEDQLCPQVKRVQAVEPVAPARTSGRSVRRVTRRCACGEPIRKLSRTVCYRCAQRAEYFAAKKPRLTCKREGCSAIVNSNNKAGLCSKHGSFIYKRTHRLKKFGPAPICSFTTGTMHCAQPLYRTNQSGLCRFHVPKPTKGKPHMIPQSSRKVAQP